MACVICGKKQRIIPVHTVKYSTQNTLPEVLSSAIGNKITSENWNEKDKHICYGCNRQCEEFDKLNTRLQDLKDHLLQEYTKRLLREADGTPDVSFKPIHLRVQDCEDGGVISDDGAREEISTEKDKSKDEGAPNERGKEIAEKEGKSKGDDKDKAEEGASTNPVTMVIKTEELDEEETLDDPEWRSQNLPENVSDDDAIKNKKQVIRLTEKTNLRRLPDFEYRQWYSLDGYSYVLHTQNTRGQLLRCHKRGCGVSARVTTGALVKICGEHTHEPDVRIVERNKLYAKLKDRCMTDPTTPLRTIYEQESAKFPGGASCLPFPEVRMREWRAANDATIVVHTDASTLEDTGKRFQCEVCNMGFNSSRLLIRHAEKHNKSKTVGRKKMSGNVAFIASSPMTAEKNRLKKKLDKTLSRVISRLKADEINESENDTENDAPDEKRCHKCEKEFTTLKQLKMHIVKEHREVLMCVHCDVAFDTRLLLRRHQTSCRKCCNERLLQRDADNTRERAAAQDEEMAQELGRITGQDVTDYVSQDENDPNWEVTNAEDSTADEGDGEVRIRKRKSNENANRPQQCEVCLKTFPNLQQLNTHLYTHSSKKKYECTICGDNFNKKAVLTRHMIAQNHRGRIKINPPEIDSRVWSETQGIRCVWDGTKYECVVCATSFPRKVLLLQHMKDEEHISDQIIIHDAQPEMVIDNRRKRFKKRNDEETILNHNDSQMCPKTEAPDEPIALGGLRFNSKTEAIRAWYDYSGKRPYECAVCGTGFMSKIRLLAHMEDTEHLADSIVENIPVLEDMIVHVADTANQIVPSEEMHEVPIEIKQESGRVEILSQVVITPDEARARETALPKTEEDRDQTYFVQAENVNGETVMVIQGDLEGSLHENMQLFMDEEGNIVTQDEEGNTVQVMQLDLSAMQEMQGRGAEEEESEDDGEYAVFHDDTPGAGLYVDGTGQADDSMRNYYEENERLMNRTHDNVNATQYNEEPTQFNEEAIQVTEQATQVNEEATQVNEAVTQNYEETTKYNIMKKQQEYNEETIQANEEATQVNEEATQNNETVTQDYEEASQYNIMKKQQQYNEETTQVNEETTQNNEAVTQDYEEASHYNIMKEQQQYNEQTTQVNKEATQNNEEVTQDYEEATQYNKETTQVNEEATQDNKELCQNNVDEIRDNEERAHDVEEPTHDNEKGTEDNAERIESDNNKEATQENKEGSHDVQETQDNEGRTHDNEEQTQDNEKGTEDNAERIESDNNKEATQENKEGSNHFVEGTQDNEGRTHDNEEQIRDNEEQSRNNAKGIEGEIKSEQDIQEVNQDSVSGINNDVALNQDEGSQIDTERTKHIVAENKGNTEETKNITEEMEDNTIETHDNTQAIQNTREGTNMEDVKDKASHDTKNIEKTQEKSGKHETGSTEEKEEDRTEKKTEESELQRVKQNRTEQKDSKAALTPRMKTRHLEKIEKAEASITSRLRRSRNQK